MYTKLKLWKYTDVKITETMLATSLMTAVISKGHSLLTDIEGLHIATYTEDIEQ